MARTDRRKQAPHWMLDSPARPAGNSWWLALLVEVWMWVGTVILFATGRIVEGFVLGVVVAFILWLRVYEYRYRRREVDRRAARRATRSASSEDVER